MFINSVSKYLILFCLIAANHSFAKNVNGVVSSARPIATETGMKILGNGGNAFDAAIAVAATLNVVEPMMSGIGGYGTILIYDDYVRIGNAHGIRITRNAKGNITDVEVASDKRWKFK